MCCWSTPLTAGGAPRRPGGPGGTGDMACPRHDRRGRRGDRRAPGAAARSDANPRRRTGDAALGRSRGVTMCLPETALLVEDHGEGVERWGMVTRDGRTQKVGLAFVPDANLGDILLIH